MLFCYNTSCCGTFISRTCPKVTVCDYKLRNFLQSVTGYRQRLHFLFTFFTPQSRKGAKQLQRCLICIPQRWRPATCWHADIVPCPNCLLSSCWTSAVTSSVWAGCDCCGHIFSAGFLWWHPNTTQAPSYNVTPTCVVQHMWTACLSAFVISKSLWWWWAIPWCWHWWAN